MASPRSPRLHTPFCDRLEIEVPIISVGMGPISGPDLTAAVSNARGLGVLGCTSMSADGVRAVIRRTRELTDRPFGVDPILPARLDQGGVSVGYVLRQVPAEHREFAARMATELGVEPRDGAEVVIAQGPKAVGTRVTWAPWRCSPKFSMRSTCRWLPPGALATVAGLRLRSSWVVKPSGSGPDSWPRPKPAWRRGKRPGSWPQPTSRRS